MTKSPILYPLIASILFFVVVNLNLQLSPMKGIADNGDFDRIMTWFNLSHYSQSEDGKYLNWVDRYYSFNNTKIVGKELTSGLVFVYIAKVINSVFNENIFDLKILGLVNTFSFSVLLFFALYYLRKINKYLLLLAVPFMFFVLIDTNYVSYFNSFYEESAGMIFLMFFLVVNLKLLSEKFEKFGNLNYWLLATSSILLISAKPQYFVFSVPILLVINLIFYKKISNRFLLTFSIFISIFSILYYIIGTPSIIKKWNVYNTVFAQILGNTNNVDRAGKIIGIEGKYFKYAGIPAYFDDEGVNDAGIQKDLIVGTYLKVIKYYLSTPRELYNLTKNLSNVAFKTNISFLGYYERKNNFDNFNTPQNGVIWSSLKEKIGGHVGQLVPFYLIASSLLLICIYVFRKNIYSIIGVFLSTSAICQFLIVLSSEGVYGVPEKHLLMFNVLNDLLLLYWIIFITSQFKNKLFKSFS